MHTPTLLLIQPAGVIIMFHCWMICVHAYQWNKRHRRWSHSSSVTGSKRLMRLQSCEKAMGWCSAQFKMLLYCVKNILNEWCNFELAHLKKRNKRKTFCFGTFVMFLCATRSLVGHETQEDEWYVVTKAYKFTILRVSFTFSYYCTSKDHLLKCSHLRIYNCHDGSARSKNEYNNIGMKGDFC